LTIYGKLVDQLLPNCQLMPGARRLVEHLHKSSAQMAICTGSASDEFAKKVDNCQDLVTTVCVYPLNPFNHKVVINQNPGEMQ
jgi:phosphoserine phosphatase